MGVRGRQMRKGPTEGSRDHRRWAGNGTGVRGQYSQYRKKAGPALGCPVQGPWGAQPSHCRCLGSQLSVAHVG